MNSERHNLDGGPVVLSGLFDEQTYATILDFMNQRVPLLRLDKDDKEFVRRSAHNVPFFVGIHHQLTALATELFGEPVKPSYCFLSLYENNGICPLHIDRPQCRYTIDYLIRQTQTEPWPIHIGKHMTDEQLWEIQKDDAHPQSEEDKQNRIANDEWTTANLMPNDAVCYSGTHSWHYRSQRLNGTADLVFFHFVPVDFAGSLN